MIILQFLLAVLIYLHQARCDDFQCPRNISQDNVDGLHAFKQAFPGIDVVKPTGNPLLGGQNYTYCCILALDKFVRNGCANSSDVSVSGLRSDSQFPCGAQWNGNVAGAPLVRTTYAWTAGQCPGWQISSATNLNQWLQLLVGFVLTAVVFCLNIPRRRKIKVWDGLFPDDISNYRLISALFGATLALVIVILDTILWLLIVFAIAAPLLLSGLYEARLDKRVVAFVDDKERSRRLPIALRARMLFTVLCGNLDLFPAWSDTMYLANLLDILSDAPAHEVVTTAQDIERPIAEQGLAPAELISGGEADETIDVTKSADIVDTDIDPRPPTSNIPISEDERGEMIDKVSSRLTAMLACQYSFGSVIGAPILFYIGSFIYTLLEIRQTYGNSDVAYALSFGMWWMCIPHIAIVAGLLLGGNNPNTLEGIVGGETADYQVGGHPPASTSLRRLSSFAMSAQQRMTRKVHSKVFGRVYEAAFKPASMWNRGRSKQSWLLVLYADSLTRYKSDDKVFKDDVRPSMEQFLTETIMFGLVDWIYLASTAISLVVVPCIFAFCLSYWTPQVGLACRSLTFTVYASAQALLAVLFTIRTTWRDELWCQGNRLRTTLLNADDKKFWTEVDKLKEMALAQTNSPLCSRFRHHTKHTSSDIESATRAFRQHDCSRTSDNRPNWAKSEDWIYYTSMSIGLGMSIFSGIGGTIMQILGVYRNNICKMNVTKWLPSRRAGAMLQLSSNSHESILEAQGTWTILGSCSVAFLIFCCYIGWWYQRRLRRHFMLVASRLDTTG